MTGMYDTRYYNYRCRDCGHETNIVDIMVDSFPPLPWSKYCMPEQQCFYSGDLSYV